MFRHLILFLIVVSIGLTGISNVFGNQSPDLKNIGNLFRSHPDSAIILLKNFLNDDNDSIKGTAYNYLGNAYYFKSEYDSAIKYYLISASIFSATGDDRSLVKNYNNLGVCYYFLTQYEKAYEYHNKTRQIRESLNDPQISSTYNNLGLVLLEIGSIHDAIRYYKKSLEAKLKFKQFSTLSTTLTNIGNVYSTLGKLDSAIYFELKNVAHLDSFPDNKNLANSYHNLGLHYYSLKKYTEAREYTNRALQLEKKTKAEFELINSCINLALINMKEGKWLDAKLYTDSVFMLVNNPEDYRNILEVYLNRSKVDSVQGNFGSAFVNLKNYVRVKSKFDKQEKANIALELEKKYQTELGEKRITELQQANLIKELEVKQARQWQLGLLVFLGLLSIVMVVLYRQFSFKKRTARLLDEKNQALQNLNEFKDKMFAVIAHDMRNPVDAFNTMTESLAENLPYASKEELQEFMTSMHQSALGLKSLLNNLLEWAMLQIGRLPMNPDAFSIRSVANDVTNQLGQISKAKGININNQIGDDKIVFSDKAMASIVLRNLLVNAIKFSSPGKEVKLSAQDSNGHVRIAIQDQGIGMSAPDLAKLFKAEENTQSIGKSLEKGAGIGLLLCKELVERNYGKIYAESELDKGSTFYIEFPRA